MNQKNKLSSLLAVMALTGLVAPPAWPAIGVKPDVKAPTVMFISPADFELRGLSVPATIPGAFENARKASPGQPASNPAVVLHRGSAIAVLPQAFTQGSKAVLVHPEGKVSLLSLTEETVVKLENDLSAGNIASAHQTLFDGVHTADSVVVDPDAQTSAANRHRAATVATLLAHIKNTPVINGGFRKGSATSLYVKRAVADRVDASSELIRRLILADRIEVAIELIRGTVPEKLWVETRFHPFDNFVAAPEVDAVVSVIAALLQRQTPDPTPASEKP